MFLSEQMFCFQHNLSSRFKSIQTLMSPEEIQWSFKKECLESIAPCQAHEDTWYCVDLLTKSLVTEKFLPMRYFAESHRSPTVINLNSYKAAVGIPMVACCELGFLLISLKWLLSQLNGNLRAKANLPLWLLNSVLTLSVRYCYE